MLGFFVTALQLEAPGPLLPALPTGARLDLESPGWTPAYGPGGLVWQSAGALCRYLERSDVCRGRACLELGSGTGACGLFAAALGASSVVLTDGGPDALLDVARRNARANAASCPNVSVRRYDWGTPLDENFDVVIGSDLTYTRADFGVLCDTLASIVRKDPIAVLLAHQQDRLTVSGLTLLDHFTFAAEERHVSVSPIETDMNIAILGISKKPDESKSNLIL